MRTTEPILQGRHAGERRQVPVMDLGAQFVMAPGETQAKFRKRLSGEVSDKRKFGRYMKAGKQGVVFPPIIVAMSNAGYFIVDGCHRTCAAAIELQQTIDAIVFRVESAAEENLVFDLALRLTQAGIGWAHVVRTITRALDARFPSTALAA